EVPGSHGKLARRRLGGRPGRPGPGRGGRTELAVENPHMEVAQLRPGLDAQLLDERTARALVDLQRLGPATAPGQRRHQLSVEALAQRMRPRQLAQLRYQLLVPP